jgi:predicted nucleotidyltransferase
VTDTIKFTKADIHRLFELLNAEMAAQNAVGEIHIVGGAVMCIALDARDATIDVDAFFKPARLIREAASRVASASGISDKWLNDAVKGFLGTRGEFDDYLELTNLRIFVAQPAYLLAMKCAAMRIGEEFHDVDDIRYLLRYLNISTVAEAMRVVTMYFDESQLKPKTRLALEELLPR